MQPYCPRGTGGICRGRLTRIPNNLFRELLRVAELFDRKVRVFEGGVTQSEAKLESWGDLFLPERLVTATT
jgi:hypothetical protein